MLLLVSQQTYPSEKLNMALVGAIFHDYCDSEEYTNKKLFFTAIILKKVWWEALLHQKKKLIHIIPAEKEMNSYPSATIINRRSLEGYRFGSGI